MKKQLIRALALTAATLCFASGALAGDVPTCPMVTWEEYAASRSAYCGETSGACTSANGLSWATDADASYSVSSGSCAAGWTAGSCSPAQSASKNDCTGADASYSVPSGSCAASWTAGACSPARSASKNDCTGADASCGASSGSCSAGWTAGTCSPVQSASKNDCTGADASYSVSSGSCAASWTMGACSPAQSASKNDCTGADASCDASSGSCAAGWTTGTYSPAQSANQNGCSSGCRNDGWCDGPRFDCFGADDSHCIFSFGAESDCTQTPSSPDGNYTAQSVSPQESALYQMVNEDRLANGVSALPLDETLSAIARAKSEDMIENGYFAHESPTYGRAAEMLDEFGYKYTSVGENIARNGSVEKAHAALMSSSSHVRNILGSQWKAVGVGVASDGNGYPYVTELFVR